MISDFWIVLFNFFVKVLRAEWSVKFLFEPNRGESSTISFIKEFTLFSSIGVVLTKLHSQGFYYRKIKGPYVQSSFNCLLTYVLFRLTGYLRSSVAKMYM